MVQLYSQITDNKVKSYFFMAFLFILALVFIFIISLATGFESDAAIVFAVIIAVIFPLLGYFYSDKAVLSISGAKPSEDKRLNNIVEEISIAAGIPQPKPYIIQDNAINAFATGRDPKNAAIAVTTGALEKLSRDELAGVIAHEASHIKNYDIRLMTFAVVMVGSIAIISDIFLRSLWFGSGRSDNDNKGSGAIIVIGIIFAILAPIFAQLAQLAISRKREYLADASGALITRYPAGLANALEKIGADQTQLKSATKTTASLYIANPFKKASLSELLSTHPPLEKRIEALRKM